VAKVLAGLAGLGLLGGARLAAKSAPDFSSTTSDGSAPSAEQPFAIKADTRSVARSADSL
jgi:hypothetical protein